MYTVALNKGSSKWCCCMFWFVAAAIFAGVFGWAFARNVTHREDGVDFSGHALCTPGNITFVTGFVWNQYPLPVGATTISPPNIPSGFVGKNFLALIDNPPTYSYVTGKVVSIDGNSFVPSASVPVELSSGETASGEIASIESNATGHRCTVTIDFNIGHALNPIFGEAYTGQQIFHLF